MSDFVKKSNRKKRSDNNLRAKGQIDLSFRFKRGRLDLFLDLP